MDPALATQPLAARLLQLHDGDGDGVLTQAPRSTSCHHTERRAWRPPHCFVTHSKLLVVVHVSS